MIYVFLCLTRSTVKVEIKKKNYTTITFFKFYFNITYVLMICVTSKRLLLKNQIVCTGTWRTYLDSVYGVWRLKDSGHWKKELGPAMTSEEIGA